VPSLRPALGSSQCDAVFDYQSKRMRPRGFLGPSEFVASLRFCVLRITWRLTERQRVARRWVDNLFVINILRELPRLFAAPGHTRRRLSACARALDSRLDRASDRGRMRPSVPSSG
jgi:hypothetical protein